jgi:Domain of unknown function (DUF1844)
MDQSDKEGSFKVNDKRKFTSDGESRAESHETFGETEGPIPQVSPREPRSSRGPESAEDFQMTFETLILSLSSTAMVQLGLVPEPSTNQPEQNLPAAKQTIDILEILQQKTKGNLDASESKLLDNILYELRMTYLEVNESIIKPK